MTSQNNSAEIWSISRMMQWMQDYLTEHDDPQPRVSTQWLISDATKLSRTELFMQMDRPLSKDELNILRHNVKRRAVGEPLQYITGEAPFRHLSIKVNTGVLIPRPETEVLVSETLLELPRPEKIRSSEFLQEEHFGVDDDVDPENTQNGDGVVENATHDEPRRILVADLCTGSGCIACSLAFEHPDIFVVATDISDEALELAAQNVCELALEDRIEIRKSDLGSDIDASRLGSFDAIVSNPPYIPTEILDSLSPEVADFEPRLALDGGKDGLDLFRRIVLWSYDALKPNGVLAVELHEDCLNEAASFARDHGFDRVRTVADLAGKPRVLVARKRDDNHE